MRCVLNLCRFIRELRRFVAIIVLNSTGVLALKTLCGLVHIGSNLLYEIVITDILCGFIFYTIYVLKTNLVLSKTADAFRICTQVVSINQLSSVTRKNTKTS